MPKNTGRSGVLKFLVSDAERKEIVAAARRVDLTPSAWLRALALSEARKIQLDHDRWHALTPKEFKEVVIAGLGISTVADRKRVLASLGISTTSNRQRQSTRPAPEASPYARQARRRPARLAPKRERED